MKKLILLAVLLISVMFIVIGCQSEKNDVADVSDGFLSESEESIPTIHLLVDFMINQIGDSILDYVQRVPGYGTEFIIEYSYLPAEGAERDSQITSLRTQILAGKGPDVFICSCPSDNYDLRKPLFTFPDQIMEQHIFLPLDKYLKNAQYMEWDKLFQPVMEAGKNTEGQQVLPISYVISAMLFDSSFYSYTENHPMTWEELLESDNQMSRYATSYVRLSDAFGELADYKSDQLTFTEEEILSKYLEVQAVRSEMKDLMISLKVQDTNGVTQLDIGAPDIPLLGDQLDDSAPNYIMIPQYNSRGGITANITAFTAINRNTQHPDISFRLVDALLSKEIQGKSTIYGNLKGMPVHTELGQKEQPALTIFGETWYMNEWNFQQYSDLLNQVNAVKFYTELDYSISQISLLAEQRKKPLETIVHDQYMTMQMMLAES